MTDYGYEFRQALIQRATKRHEEIAKALVEERRIGNTLIEVASIIVIVWLVFAVLGLVPV